MRASGSLYDQYVDAALRGEREDPRAFLERHGSEQDTELLACLERLHAMAPEPSPCLQSASGAEGSLFGPYRILSEIARGGMGIVYRAHHQEMNRTVALKVILAARHADERTRQRFLLEARATSKLNHPNIVQIYDVGLEQGERYFAMRLVEGQTLDLLIEQDPPRETLLRVIIDVARAIHHAHLHGIIHRDLKPANVLIDAAGAPVVTDFGLAKILGSEDPEGQPNLTRSGVVVGTPHYMSPEQAVAGSVDLRSDVYSLGAMLYQCITGTPPYEDDHLLTLLARVQSGAYRPLGTSFPKDLRIITEKAIEREPRRRYQSAEALAHDLEAYLEGRPIEARGASVPYRAWRLIARYRLPTALATMMLILAFGGIWHNSSLPATLKIITVDASAEVTLDGRSIGRTEARTWFRHQATPGRHVLRVQADGFRPYETTLELKANENRPLHIPLVRTTGLLHISTSPGGAAVFQEVDGKTQLLLPSTPGNIELLAGTYQLQLRLAGHASQRHSVTVYRGGKLTEKSWTLTPIRGALQISSSMTGMTLEVRRGEQTRRFELPQPANKPIRLPPGRYDLHFSKPGFLPQTHHGVTIKQDQLRRRWVNLHPIRRGEIPEMQGRTAEAIFVGDTNRNGRPDILVLAREGPMLLERIPGGRQRWAARWRHPWHHGWGQPATRADINGDHAPDLIAQWKNGSTGQHMLICISGLNGARIASLPLPDSLVGLTAADLLGDRTPELVCQLLDGQVWVIDARAFKKIWGVTTIRGTPYAQPTLADLDGDGRREMIVLSGDRRRLRIYDPRSRTLLHERVNTNGLTSVSVGDLDGDGKPELVLGTNQGELIALRAMSWEVAWRNKAGQGAIIKRPVLARLGTDGPLDVLFVDGRGSLRAHSGRDGRTLWSFDKARGSRASGLPLADWSGDGIVDPLVILDPWLPSADPRIGSRLAVIDGRSGRALWETRIERWTGALELADLDADGVPELYAGTQTGRLIWISPRLDLAWCQTPRSRVVDQLLLANRHGPAIHVMALDWMVSARWATQLRPLYQNKLNGGLSFLASAADLNGDGIADFWQAAWSGTTHAGFGVRAVSGLDGRELWRDVSRPAFRITRRPLDLDGDGIPDPVILSDTSGPQQPGTLQAIAYAGRTGKLLWRTALTEKVPWTCWNDRRNWDVQPVAARFTPKGPPRILIPIPTRGLVVLDGRSGTRLWSKIFSFQGAHQLKCSPLVCDVDGNGRRELLQVKGPRLLRYDCETGRLLSQTMLQDFGAATPQLYLDANDQPCLLLTMERGLRAIGLRPWRELWHHRSFDQLNYARPSLVDLSGDGVADVLCATNRNRLLLLDGRTGQRIWGYQASSSNEQWTTSPIGMRLPEGNPLILVPCRNRFSAVRARVARRCPSWTSDIPGDGRTGDHTRHRTHLEQEAALTQLLRRTMAHGRSSAELLLALDTYQTQPGSKAWCRCLRARIEIARTIELAQRKQGAKATAALQRAEQIVVPLLREFPHWIEPLVCQARIQQLRGQTDLAAQTIGRAIDLAPGLGRLHFWRARFTEARAPALSVKDYQAGMQLEATFLSKFDQDYIGRKIRELAESSED